MQYLPSLIMWGTFVVVTGLGPMIGKGKWKVLHIQLCEDWQQYELQLNITRRRVNHTHDYFDGRMEVDREINDNIGVYIDIYKKVDGGFKMYQNVIDESICHFLHKYAEENFQELLRVAGAESDDCPVKPGIYAIFAHVFNYNALNSMGIYGTYKANGYLTQDGRRIACVSLICIFQPEECDSDEDDEE